MCGQWGFGLSNLRKVRSPAPSNRNMLFVPHFRAIFVRSLVVVVVGLCNRDAGWGRCIEWNLVLLSVVTDWLRCVCGWARAWRPINTWP